MKPERIGYIYLRERFLCNFTDMFKDENRGLLNLCIEDVYKNYAGVEDVWSHLPERLYVDKTQLCYAYLVAWYITDSYPQYVVGVNSVGAIPLREKRIGQVLVKYDNTSTIPYGKVDDLAELKSNNFGMKAYYMLKKSGKLNTFIRSK